MTLGTEARQPEANQAECIQISQSVTLGTEASKPKCIEINRSVVTLGTKFSQPVCIEISRSVTLGTEVQRPVSRSV